MTNVAPGRWDRPDPVDRADRDGPDGSWPPPGLLEDTLPGPGLAALLNTVSVSGLGAGVLVEYVAAAARQASWSVEREVAAIAELTRRTAGWRGVGPRPDQVSAAQMAATEVGAALSLCPATARARVEFAQDLQRLPLTRLGLATGRIDAVKARAVVEAVDGLEDAAAAAVEARVIPRAPTQTAPALRAALRRAVISQDPAAAQHRRDRAAIQRSVSREALPDGMARLDWVGPAEQVETTYTWITAKALATQAAARAAGNHPPTLDQARSDVLGDLGACGLMVEDLPTRHGRRPHIGVVVALSTLLGHDDQPADLTGIGPITAHTARRIAAHGTWRRLLVDPRTGRLDEMSTTTYQPPQDMRDHVIARDRTCRGLGCRVPADRCDIDHRIPHPTGPTTITNLDATCRSWHRVKTLTDTHIDDDGHGGLHITLPSGHRYHQPPQPTLDHPHLNPQPHPPLSCV